MIPSTEPGGRSGPRKRVRPQSSSRSFGLSKPKCRTRARHPLNEIGMPRRDLKRPVVVTLRRCVVPNIGRQLILERCIHGVAEQFQSRIRTEGNSALYNQPLLVVHDDLQTLELVAIHGPNPAQEGGALIELELGCIGTGPARRARLSENRRAEVTPLDRPCQDRAVEYDVFGKQLAYLGGCGLT